MNPRTAAIPSSWNEPSEREIPLEEREIFYTGAGRKVYGGGGITPDHIVKPIETKPFYGRLFRQNVFFDFSVRYANARPDLEPGFRVGEETLNELRAFLDEKDIEYDEIELQESLPEIKLKLRAQISRVKWGQEAESRALAEEDPQVRRALELFPAAAKLQARGEDGSGPSARLGVSASDDG